MGDNFSNSSNSMRLENSLVFQNNVGGAVEGMGNLQVSTLFYHLAGARLGLTLFHKGK